MGEVGVDKGLWFLFDLIFSFISFWVRLHLIEIGYVRY